MTVHDDLKAVLDQLESMDAKVVTFNPFDLSEMEAHGWLNSERDRLGRLSRLMGEQQR